MKIVGATGLGGLWTLEWAWLNTYRLTQKKVTPTQRPQAAQACGARSASLLREYASQKKVCHTYFNTHKPRKPVTLTPTNRPSL